MKLIYLTADGIAKIENVGTVQYIECDDGYHPINPDSIFWHKKRKYDSLIFIFAHNREPIGYQEHYIQKKPLSIIEVYAQKLHQMKTRISKKWKRKLMTYFFILSEFMILFCWLIFLSFLSFLTFMMIWSVFA